MLRDSSGQNRGVVEAVFWCSWDLIVVHICTYMMLQHAAICLRLFVSSHSLLLCSKTLMKNAAACPARISLIVMITYFPQIRSCSDRRGCEGGI